MTDTFGIGQKGMDERGKGEKRPFMTDTKPSSQHSCHTLGNEQKGMKKGKGNREKNRPCKMS